MFGKLFRWRKPFVTNKEELLALSDAEKGLISDHRKKMLGVERGQIRMQNEIATVFYPDKSADQVEYLYDILGGWNSTNNQILPINELVTQNPTITGTPAQIVVRVGSEEKVIGNVVAVNPKDVVHELERYPGPEIIENIDAKIHVLKTKHNLIQSNHYCKNEMIDMVTRLENRKKWVEFKEFYEQFDNTTSDKIQDLVNKYKLVLKGSDLFVAAFPDEAIAIMKEYKEQTVKLCGKAPIFYVIAEESNFKDEYKKKDPILLAQSPFGAYWQILGAWDKEMILLEEL